MKIEQLFVQYLYHSKKAALQGIGIFQLDPSIAIPDETEKDFSIPENGITFTYDPKIAEDDGLITYIVKHTGKIKPLAAADLDSYVILAKQFLNIGKPLTIEGIGTIQKSQSGSYLFTSGQFITPRITDAPTSLKEKKEESVSFESESKPDNQKRNFLFAVVGLFIILGGIGVYYLFYYQQHLADNNAPQVNISTDTTQIAKDSTHRDSLQAPLTDSTLSVSNKRDSNALSIVIREFPSREPAEKSLLKLKGYGHDVKMIAIDSEKFLIAIPLHNLTSDTSRIKDSLNKFFGVQSYIINK